VRAIVLVAAGDQHAQALRALLPGRRVHRLARDDLAGDHGEVRETLLGTTPCLVDDLLARYEQRLGEDSGKRASAAAQAAQRERHRLRDEQWTDAETGLFDAPFASFKIDEELSEPTA
jgi:hypothetical protein